MKLLCKPCFLCGYSSMDRAAAVKKLYVLVRTFLSDIAAQVAVGNEEYVFFFHIIDDLLRRRACYTNVADRFQLGSRVNISNDRIVGIIILYA